MSKQHIFNLSLSQVKTLYLFILFFSTLLHFSPVQVKMAYTVGTVGQVAMLAMHLMPFNLQNISTKSRRAQDGNFMFNKYHVYMHNILSRPMILISLKQCCSIISKNLCGIYYQYFL